MHLGRNVYQWPQIDPVYSPAIQMVMEKDKISDWDVKIFIPRWPFIYLCPCLDTFKCSFISLNNFFKLLVYPYNFTDGLIVIILP